MVSIKFGPAEEAKIGLTTIMEFTNYRHCQQISPVIALPGYVANTCKFIKPIKTKDMETVMLKDALTVIEERKSVRSYTGERVSEEDINKILHAAMAAPAAIHLLPWKFIVVTGKEKLNALADGLPFARMISKAGTCIVVCAVPEEAALNSEAFAILDCTCASENILLATEALGLGAVWTAVYPNNELMDFVRKELNIPPNVIPLNVIPVGYPTGEEETQDKFDQRNIHWEKW